MAIRRPDGYVGKPPSAGTGVFAMDTGNGSSTIPNFDSEFPVDFALVKKPAVNVDWYTGSRLTSGSFMYTNANSAEGTSSEFVFDSNLGWCKGSANDSTYQSWMWKRGQGFDVVTWLGTNGNVFRRHNLGTTPEMIIFKNRDAARSWRVYHKGMNGGTNPEDYEMALNGTSAEGSNTSYMNGTAPTSTHFVSGNDGDTNGAGDNYIALLFASANDADGNPISKVGSYSGDGSSNLTITTGFQPRFILIKPADSGGSWHLFDSVRGMGATDKLLQVNSTAAQLDVDYVTVSATGWNTEGTSLTNGNYIYYAHA